MKVVATYSIKGGVGKTTSAVNLAHAAGASGARVLVWDLDPQGAATFFLRTKPGMKGGAKRMVGPKGELAPHVRSTDFAAVQLVPADFSLRNLDVRLDEVKHPVRRLADLLHPMRDDYDIAILDCPPSISLASESVFAACDALLVPTIPTPLSARTLSQLTGFLADWSHPPNVLPYISMLDGRKKLQREVVDQLTADWPGLLRTHVPNSSAIERMGAERAPLGAFAGGTRRRPGLRPPVDRGRACTVGHVMGFDPQGHWLDPGIGAYIADHAARPDELQRQLIAETIATTGGAAGMQISPDHGALLALFVGLTNARFVVEVGTFTGYSSLCMARALPSGGRLLCCDVSTEWTTIARRYWALAGVDGRITLRIAPAADTLRALPRDADERIDLAFIDADKTGYAVYYEEILQRMRTNGLILVDNTLWSGKVLHDADADDANTLALQQFNDAVAADHRVESYILPVSDGLTVIRKR